MNVETENVAQLYFAFGNYEEMHKIVLNTTFRRKIIFLISRRPFNTLRSSRDIAHTHSSDTQVQHMWGNFDSDKNCGLWDGRKFHRWELRTFLVVHSTLIQFIELPRRRIHVANVFGDDMDLSSGFVRRISKKWEHILSF